MSDSHRPPVVFHSLDRHAEIEISTRNLPHWFQVDSAIFVTFRTADSLPKEVILRMERELVAWLNDRNLPIGLAESILGDKYSFHYELLNQLDVSEQRNLKKLVDRLVQHSLDECHGECPLRDPALAQIVADSIAKFDGQRYDLDSYVIMPNHVHALVQFREGYSLKTVSQSWMRYTARMINQQLSQSGVFWQAEPFDHIVRSPEQFEYLQRYIAENPAKAKLKAGEYMYWKRES